MPLITTTVECPVHRSFRVDQVAGLFDVGIESKAAQSFSVEIPAVDEDWQIGLIIGPSGSGKSTIARAAFGEAAFYHGGPETWPADRAVVDAFDEQLSARDITGMLSSVGFSSPPSWVKPWHVLSNGEKFRCDLARALLRPDPLVVFDEFTSVVDRTVAKIGSAAVSKAVRRDPKRKLVAVSCHSDIRTWLQPDWVVDMATCQLARGRLCHPPIRFQVFRAEGAAWRLFARHHYLSGSLSRAARCYLACWNGEPVSFCATINSAGHKAVRRVTRMVTLPDYQGIGVGMHLLNVVAEREASGVDDRGTPKRVTITTSHPAMIGALQRSSVWRCRTVTAISRPHVGFRAKGYVSPGSGRSTVSFEYRKTTPPTPPTSGGNLG